MGRSTTADLCATTESHPVKYCFLYYSIDLPRFMWWNIERPISQGLQRQDQSLVPGLLKHFLVLFYLHELDMMILWLPHVEQILRCFVHGPLQLTGQLPQWNQPGPPGIAPARPPRLIIFWPGQGDI